MISFTTKPYKIGSRTIVLLPQAASNLLPSRGLVMVKGKLNGADFQTALEPDGRGSHWFELDNKSNTSEVTLEIEVTKDWSEPTIPTDVSKALKTDQKAYHTWSDVTPMARWEWIRWIRATNNPETRKKHIEVALSKLRAGNRRPCCFNARMCSDFTVSKGGVLLGPN